MKRILDNLFQKWKALAPQRRILLGAAVATLLIGGYVLVSRANQVTWAVLYANVDDSTASNVMASLDGKGIQYKLDGNGTRILVPAGNLDATRIALASEGISGQAIPDGFAEIFDNQGLSTTDYAQKVNYERALEGELARTLLGMDAVSGANVQLSIPEESVFIGRQSEDTDVPTASVLLQLKRPLTQDEVDTVANLMASSVPGLTIDQVTVASTDGTLLKSQGDASSAGSSSSLEMTQAYETRLRNQLTELVRNIPGAANATVSVTAELSFTESTVQKETLDPELVAVAEQTSEENWEGDGSLAGGIVGVDGGPIDGAANSGTGTYSKVDTTTQAQSTEHVVTSTQDSTPVVKRLGIAVMIPAGEDAAANLDATAIQELVSAAANVNAERNDVVAVQIVPIAAPTPADGTETGDGLVTEATPAVEGMSPYMIVVGFLIGAIGVIIFGVTRRRQKAKKARAAEAAEKLAALGMDPTLANFLNLAPDKKEKAEKTKKDKGDKKKKKKKGEADEEPELELAPLGPSAADHKMAMDEIKGDLEKILAESPESLATLLSGWMTK